MSTAGEIDTYVDTDGENGYQHLYFSAKKYFCWFVFVFRFCCCFCFVFAFVFGGFVFAFVSMLLFFNTLFLLFLFFVLLCSFVLVWFYVFNSMFSCCCCRCFLLFLVFFRSFLKFIGHTGIFLKVLTLYFKSKAVNLSKYITKYVSSRHCFSPLLTITTRNY